MHIYCRVTHTGLRNAVVDYKKKKELELGRKPCENVVISTTHTSLAAPHLPAHIQQLKVEEAQ